MKKRLLLIPLLTAAACGTAAIAGCSKQPAEKKEPPHSHSYDVTTVEASCGQEGYDSHVCECGEHYEDNVKPALRHELQNDECVNCGKTATQGLEIENGVLVGLGTAKDEKDILVPSSVTTIGERVFAFSDVEYVTLPSSVSVLSDWAFWCSKIRHITLTSVMKMGHHALATCDQLEEVDLRNVKEIGEFALAYCPKLKSVNLPASVTKIGASVFNGCTALEEVTLDNANYNYYATGGCIIERETGKLVSAVSACKIPSSGSVTEIADGAFNGAVGIESFTVPAGVTKLGSEVFANSDLKHITIGKDVTELTPHSFGNLGTCPDIESITVDPENPKYYSENNCIIERDTKILIRGCKNSVIPEDVKEIGANAFDYIKTLKKIDIPASVTKIGGYAFYMSGLQKLTTHITGASAFANCESLTEVTISEGATKIENTAFRSCSSLLKVTLPSTLTSIDSRAFDGDYKLVEVYNLSSSLSLTPGSDTNGCVAQYAKAVYTDATAESKIDLVDDWAYYVDGENVTLLGYAGSYKNVTLAGLEYKGKTATLDQYVFAGLDVDSLTLNGITSYTQDMFRNTTHIENLTINGNASFEQKTFVRNIYGNITINGTEDVGTAFYNCGAVSVTLNGVKTLGNQAFAFSENLEKVVLGEGLTEIGQYALYSCAKLSQVTLPSTLKILGYGAFYQDSALKEITLPQGLEKIDAYAFMNCAIESLTLPASVKEIGLYAVWGCPIKDIVIPDGSGWKVYLEREGETAGWHDAELNFKNLTEGYSDGTWKKQ